MLRSLLSGAMRSGALSGRRGGGYGGTTGGYGGTGGGYGGGMRSGGGLGMAMGLASRFMRRR